MDSSLTNIDKLVNWVITLDLNRLTFSFSPLLGVLIGVFGNEYFKRKRRESLYSDIIFQKKLEVNEKLYEKLNKASEIAHEIINIKSPKNKRHETWSRTVLDIADYADKNKLYLNEEVVVHCLIMLIGVENIQDLSKTKKKQETTKFYENLQDASNLIKEETGLKRLDKFFKKINKPSIHSSYIDYYREKKKEYKIKN